VANPTSNNVSGYTIDPGTGALTAAPGSPFSAGGSPSAVTIDPASQFAFVANSVSADLTVFKINLQTAALRQIAGSPFLTGAGMEIAGVTVDPTGKFLYVANFGSSSVSAFTISASGALAPVTGSPILGDTCSTFAPFSAGLITASSFPSRMDPYALASRGSLRRPCLSREFAKDGFSARFVLLFLVQ
jgi:DNA-binding beta-propeller fold protein YncE